MPAFGVGETTAMAAPPAANETPAVIETRPAPAPETMRPAATEIEVPRYAERAPVVTPPAPAPAERAIEPPVPAPAVQAAPVALQPIVLPPELELVETNPEKVRMVASKPEPAQAPRPPRVRPPLPPVSEEPLVQIETQR